MRGKKKNCDSDNLRRQFNDSITEHTIRIGAIKRKIIVAGMPATAAAYSSEWTDDERAAAEERFELERREARESAEKIRAEVVLRAERENADKHPFARIPLAQFARRKNRIDYVVAASNKIVGNKRGAAEAPDDDLEFAKKFLELSEASKLAKKAGDRRKIRTLNEQFDELIGQAMLRFEHDRTWKTAEKLLWEGEKARKQQEAKAAKRHQVYLRLDEEIRAENPDKFKSVNSRAIEVRYRMEKSKVQRDPTGEVLSERQIRNILPKIVG